MKKVKFFYNPQTLKYEKFETPFRVKLLRAFGILSAFIVSSAIVIWLYTKFVPKPTDGISKRRYELLKDDYDNLSDELKELQHQMAELEKRDNEVYRSIFEANPVPDSMRANLIEKAKEIEKVNTLSDEFLSKDIATQLNNIKARLEYQKNSFSSIEKLISTQDVKLASIPAIQPLSNKNLSRVASGFGMRIHPIYGIPKMHNGLDFTAPQGTPIYATGDGIVTMSGTGTGTGNHVIINHGYGYETVYMHMVKIKVRVKQKVKRGEVIGWVGSTGASTGPHCHYEVHVNGNPVDPVYFFYNDLNAEEYDRMLKLAATGSAKSFD